MSIFGRYLTRIFVSHLVLILASAVALLQLFDVMSNTDDLLSDLGGGHQVILRYTMLRLPILVTFLLPFSVLLAALMTFGRLHRHSELVAMQAQGVPIIRIVLLLLPVMLVVAFLHFLISDQITPPANRTLADWQASSQEREPNDIALWVHDGGDLVSIGHIEEKGRRLEDIVIFRRDENGNLVMQAKAALALHDRDGWWLHQVEELAVRPAAKHAGAVIAREAWRTGLRPGLVVDLAAPPNALSIGELKRILKHPDVGSRPRHVYQTWLQKSFSLPLASLFMVALATASVRSLQRQGGVVLNALVGFGGAFLYFIVDGVLQALGEAGSVPPALAAWLPLVFLALISGAVLYWVAMPRGGRKGSAVPPPAGEDDKLATA